MPPQFLDSRLPDRFWDKVQPCPMSGCWLWTASADPKGYGRITMPTPSLAHRIAYLTLVGEISAETPMLDHKCRQPSCVNPAHLEPVTNLENVRRGIAGHAQASRTHCPAGHPYDGDNLFFIPNKTRSERSRCCRICKNHRNLIYRLNVAHFASLRPLGVPSPELLAEADALLAEAIELEAAGAVTRKTKMVYESVPVEKLLKGAG